MSASSLYSVDPVKIVDYILPVLLPKLPRMVVQASSATAVTGDGSGMAEHDIAGAYHTGMLADAQAPQFLKTDGTRGLTGHLAVSSGITIDGVDLSAHVSDPEAHHALVTVSGPLTITGQLVGLSYGDGLALEDLTRLVVKLDGNSGLKFGDFSGLQLGTPTIVGVGSSNSVSTNTHSHAVDYTTAGAANKLLALDVNSRAYAAIHEASTKVRTPLIDTASGDLTIIPADDLFLTPNGDIDIIAGSNVVRLGNSNTIKSANYASQTTGWAITYDGAGDFRYLYADEMHVKVFIADLEQALAGGQIISKSVAQLSYQFSVPPAGGVGDFWVRDLPSAQGMRVFANGDYVRFRKFTRSEGSLDVSDAWGTVVFHSFGTGVDSSGSTYQRWTFTRSSGGNAGAMASYTNIEPGSLVLDYGKSGNGYYEVNAIDGLNAVNSPYLQFVRWTGHPHSGKSVRVRLGQLRGMFGVDEFGMFVGSGTTSSDTYLRLSDYADGNGINNLPLTMFKAGNKAVVIDPDEGISLYSSGSYGDISNRINFFNRVAGSLSGYIAASHDTDWFRMRATRGLLELTSQYTVGGSPGNEVKLVLDGQGYGSTRLNTGSLTITASDGLTSKVLSMGPDYTRIDGYDVWTKGNLVKPVEVGGLYSYIRLDYLQTNAIRGASLAVLNLAGNNYVRVHALDIYLGGQKILAPGHVSIRNTADNGYYGVTGSLFHTTDGYVLSGNIIKMMNPAATAYQRIATGQISAYIPNGQAWAGAISGEANGSAYTYFDYNYNGVRSGYLLWDATTMRMQASNYAYIGGSRVGINTVTPAYDFDVSGEMRATGSIRADRALSIGRIPNPGASAVYCVIFFDAADNKLKYMLPGGGTRVISYT